MPPQPECCNPQLTAEPTLVILDTPVPQITIEHNVINLQKNPKLEVLTFPEPSPEGTANIASSNFLIADVSRVSIVVQFSNLQPGDIFIIRLFNSCGCGTIFALIGFFPPDP